MAFYIQTFLVLLLTIIFIIKKKPNVIYLFLGYFFFFITLILSLPFKLLQLYLVNLFPIYVSPSQFVFSIFFSIFFIVTNYFAIKKFIKTKKLKNAILFGLGWTSLYSISEISNLFYTYFFNLFNLNLNPSLFIPKSIFSFEFFFAFPITLAIFILIIKSILKKSKLYLFYAFSLIIVTNFSLNIADSILKYVIFISIFLISFNQLFSFNSKNKFL